MLPATPGLKELKDLVEVFLDDLKNWDIVPAGQYVRECFGEPEIDESDEDAAVDEALAAIDAHWEELTEEMCITILEYARIDAETIWEELITEEIEEASVIYKVEEIRRNENGAALVPIEILCETLGGDFFLESKGNIAELTETAAACWLLRAMKGEQK